MIGKAGAGAGAKTGAKTGEGTPSLSKSELCCGGASEFEESVSVSETISILIGRRPSTILP